MELSRSSSQQDFDRANHQIQKVLAKGEVPKVLSEANDTVFSCEVWVGALGDRTKVTKLVLGRDSSRYVNTSGQPRVAPTVELDRVSLYYPAWGSTTAMGIGALGGTIGGFALLSWLTEDSLDNPGPHTKEDWRATGIAMLTGATLGFLVGFIFGKHDSGHDIVLHASAVAALSAPGNIQLSLKWPRCKWPRHLAETVVGTARGSAQP
jgi:hypothetical protein